MAADLDLGPAKVNAAVLTTKTRHPIAKLAVEEYIWLLRCSMANILVIDENKEQRSALLTLFGEMGHTATEAWTAPMPPIRLIR